MKLPRKYAVLFKVVDIHTKSKKEVGTLGESLACEYLKRHGFRVLERNVTRKTGELDVVARKENVLHIVEVKTVVCKEFPTEESPDTYDPADNLHPYKLQKVARTGEWYVANIDWEEEWQVDGVLVWLRECDGMARVRYLPQIL